MEVDGGPASAADAAQLQANLRRLEEETARFQRNMRSLLEYQESMLTVTRVFVRARITKREFERMAHTSVVAIDGVAGERGASRSRQQQVTRARRERDAHEALHFPLYSIA